MRNWTIFGWLLMAFPLFLKYLSACCIVNGEVCGSSLLRRCLERLDNELDIDPNILYTCRKGKEPVVLKECMAGCNQDQQNTDGDMCSAGAAEDIPTTRMTTVKEHWNTTEQPKTGGFLVVTKGPSLWRLPVEDNGNTKHLTNIPGDLNHAVAVDCVTRHLYWAVWRKGIRRSQYDGSYNHLVVRNDSISRGLAVDFVTRNVFWVQGSNILVAKMSHLEAGHKTILSDTGINLYSALAVHPSRGSIYWSDSDRTMKTASMDGSNRRVLVTGVSALSLALDYEANDLYWADWRNDNIERISLNGGAKRIVSAQGIEGDPYGISLSGGRIYWTSWLTVTSITKSGSTMKQHSLPAGRSGRLEGIVFVPEQCPKCAFI
ncbi:putative Nidogen-1 [Hypsibius exemplaris]|uniref:Nidogen-1 n=1 Tax=Hypsibius exemplaris TaxID=2072580 RepID=A0A1W0WW54_HYPEX|nr:putative Nidogen-1 [Hypsibius exemplaris]